MGKEWDKLWDGRKDTERAHIEGSAGRTGNIRNAPVYQAGIPAQEWHYSWATQALRVLKPGGHALVFGGTRTHHRLMCALEDAGFECRDMLMWVFGSGFPKSMDISKQMDKMAGAEREVVGTKMGLPGYLLNPNPGDGVAMEGNVDGSLRNPEKEVEITAPATDAAKEWEGWGTGLKPAYEVVVLCRKPISERNVALNVLKWGTGGLNIDGCRIKAPGEDTSRKLSGTTTSSSGWKSSNRKPVAGLGDGRFPANLILDGSEEVVRLFPNSKSTGGTGSSTQPLHMSREKGDLHAISERAGAGGYGDDGSAARFFYCASLTEEELLFSRAKSIMEAWNPDLANTADSTSTLSNEHAVSALSHAVTVASLGASTLSNSKELSIAVTPTQLRQLGEMLIMATLNTGQDVLLEQQRERLSLNSSLVHYAADQGNGTTTITISPSSSDGFADAVTFNITPLNLEAGVKDSGSRIIYCAKASKSERGEGNKHPTVKPLALMRYLCRLITPPGKSILDPFMGSGTTIIAALQEGFSAIGMEQDPGSFNTAQGRVSNAEVQLKEAQETTGGVV